jgi:hypothetical protein
MSRKVETVEATVCEARRYTSKVLPLSELIVLVREAVSLTAIVGVA